MANRLLSLGRLSGSTINGTTLTPFLSNAKRLQHDLSEVNKDKQLDQKQDKNKPVKFTTSQANIDYRATRNFYYDDPTKPKSHNIVLAGTGILGFYYLIFLRDDIDNDGGVNLMKPIHETLPEMAIPLLQASIAENRKFGNNTKKLEEKLAEYMKNPEKYGGEHKKLVEN